jgi:protein O-GlcNAc transferase
MTVQQQFESALAHHRAGRLAEAEKLYRQILAQQPNHADALHMLGALVARVGQLDAAHQLIVQAISIRPGNAAYHSDLGNIFRMRGQLNESIVAFREAVRLNPGFPEAYSNMGNALRDMGQVAEAVAAYREAVRLRPDFAGAYSNLGNALTAMGQLDEAIAACRQSIRLNPNLAGTHSNLGNALKNNGQLDEAIAAYREAIRIEPGFELANSNLVYLLHFHCGYDAKMIFEEHQRWNRQHAGPLKKFIQPHTNNRDPERPLRIGYVSPDFRSHPIGRFLLALLGAHDRDRFTIFCYSDVRRPDPLTSLLQQRAMQWRNIVGVPDERVAQLIREDQIDILIDLTMHMANNRMRLFARKPAPVQVTYLAYCSTTGLETMDYRLTDPHLDPPGMNDAYYSEKSIRLPETYWCYPVHEQTPEVGPAPAVNSGEVTFGCLNNFSKVSPEALSSWIELLKSVPRSRLILHAGDGSLRQRTLDLVERAGIKRDRLKFVGKVPLYDYFKQYEQIDIGLDPFPYTGGTTTCDALWMGVPVVTLAGRTGVGRSGVSILRNIGLLELIADSPEQYVQTAAGLANDLPWLSELRRTLRDRMQGSVLMDAPRFARHIEAAYWGMWGNWCGEAGTLK